MNTTHFSSRLARRLNLVDAVFIGLGAMVGAGIFAAEGPAAQAAGSGLLIAVFIAGGVAFLNAITVAQLAVLYPESGGTYVYGRKRLGAIWGFLAGWGFITGKLASCTAMALTFAHYAAPAYARPLAAASVLLLTAVNYLGVKKTANVTRILVILVFVSLAAVVFAALAGGGTDSARLSGWTERGGVPGILRAAGIMFFAFAGYARLATLGEEVANPRTTIPKAIALSLAITIAVYFTVVTVTILSVDTEHLARATAPLVLAVESGSFAFLSPVVRIGAGLASLGVLLSLLAGISRTAFAMAANRDLPHSLSAVHPRYKVPHRTELTVGAIVATITVAGDLGTAIGFSSFLILTYYAIAHAAAWALNPSERRWPRWMAGAGGIACILVALSLPIAAIMGGILILALGLTFYLVCRPYR
ncbi:MAG: APC family permease [Bdellovibrionales bacterium]